MQDEKPNQGGSAAAPPVSPDGRFWWDGQAWQPMPSGVPSTPAWVPPPHASAWGPTYAPQPHFGAQPAQGNGFSTAGIICGAIAFLFFPIVFGPIGLILGGVAMSKKEEKAVIALVVSGCGTVIGMMLGILIFSSL